MKRFFSCLLVTILTFMSIAVTGCDFNNQNEKLSVEDSLKANYENLTERLSAAANFEEVADYLADWAKDNDIKVKTRNDKYIVLSLPATEDAKDNQSVTLQSSVALNNMDETLETLAVTLAALYSAGESHGQLDAVFTSQVKGQPVGAIALNEKYLETDNFIRLLYSSKPSLYDSIAGTTDIVASHKVKTTSPSYTKAYKIEFEGPKYLSPFLHRGYPNAVKAIGDLLASCQSSGLLFELGQFNGGDSSDLLPKTASVLVALQENDAESFMNRFNKSYETMAESYEDSDDTFVYKITEAKVPDKVISKEDTANIVSLMYTLTNGTYLKSDEGEVISYSSIGKISTDNNLFQLNINAKSLDRSIMKEMTTEIKTTCGLCDMSYKETATSPVWISSDKYSLVNSLSKDPAASITGTLEDIDATTFVHKKKDLNLAIYGVNQDDGAKQIENILSRLQ